MFLRDPGNFYGRISQISFLGLFLGLFFFNMKTDMAGVQDRMGFLYLALVNTMFNAAMNGVAAFPPERAVFLQEQANDTYNAFIYYFGKNLA